MCRHPVKHFVLDIVNKDSYRRWHLGRSLQAEGMREENTILALLDGEHRLECARGPASSLTAFERRTLELFAAGAPRHEIARLLKRAPKTISNCLTSARDKLGARSLAEAAALLAAESVSSAVRTIS